MNAESALVELVAVRSAALLRTAYLLSGNRAQAEDLLQEALFRVFRSRHRVRDLNQLEGYVRTTLVRTAIDWRRRRSSSELPFGDVPETGSRIPEPHVHGPAWDAIQRLPARQRAVVILAYYEDLSERQIADLIGCSVGSVKSHRARGLAALRIELSALAPALAGGDQS